MSTVSTADEEDLGDFPVVEVAVLPAGPVGVTVVGTLDGKPFLGLTQKIITTIFTNGDIVSATSSSSVPMPI